MRMLAMLRAPNGPEHDKCATEGETSGKQLISPICPKPDNLCKATVHHVDADYQTMFK